MLNSVIIKQFANKRHVNYLKTYRFLKSNCIRFAHDQFFRDTKQSFMKLWVQVLQMSGQASQPGIFLRSNSAVIH